MNLLLFIMVLLNLFDCNQNEMKEVSKNGMTVRWELVKDSLQIEAFAPTQGWVAIGFNKSDELKGTHLIMGCIQKGEVFIEEHYIRQPGDHIPISTLGGKDALFNRTGIETKDGTHLSFQFPLKVADPYHWHLKPGKTYYLLLAYSESDDFYHHSRMRTSVKIQL
ncbi:MAG: DOMON domain-containing protein [Saprospiraceae bacterium]|nr:DOMON domain-containing protein [Saprospiraceae bacterium]